MLQDQATALFSIKQHGHERPLFLLCGCPRVLGLIVSKKKWEAGEGLGELKKEK